MLINILNATIEYVLLLKDLKNRFFNEVTKFSNKVMNQQILYLS